MDATTALAYYGSAIDALEAAGQSVPQEVWNNVGVLQLDNGKLDEAERSLLRAVEAGGANLSQFAERNVTVTFNLARVYEARHDDLHAEELYKGILLEHPNYTDCYLRLAAMARARGAAGDASEWAKEVLQLDADHPGAIAMLASLHFDREDWAKAQKQFERLQQVAPNDGYSHVALGNIFYNARFRDGGNAKADKYLKAACERYLSALKADPANVYAANGLGIVFAEHSDIAAAREAFVQVRDATVDVPDVWVNLGHVYMLQGQYASAAKMYDTALLRNSGSNSLDSCALLLFHANALFEQHNFSECQRALQLAVRECPQCLILWYDLAVCCEEACVAALHADKEPQRYTRPQERVAAMQMALSEAKTAASIFAWLSTAKPAPHSVGGVQYKHSQGRASRHADRCRNLTEKARVAWSVA